ncbi:hypothetical protein D9M69_705950 [compost metagenome]
MRRIKDRKREIKVARKQSATRRLIKTLSTEKRVLEIKPGAIKQSANPTANNSNPGNIAIFSSAGLFSVS